ncbi:hypothetical protein THF1C08_50243 [Vibrio jasicida]|jgi:hypothetical protein|uniref:Uncharacterized protein n=1 Tax=Vibrio jasicida TaxID=766224 RepID=A0AAU9QVB2_9VIBR|nr:hypothetical protein THF1C08_50243 [Vibrio jasicida]CAH1601559.1 hypothetical protein THF1A12_50103 [Vibrio jasicida]
MFDEAKLDTLVKLASKTHSKCQPNQQVSVQVSRIMNANLELCKYSVQRGEKLTNLVSRIPMKKFSASHVLVPPVL